MTKVTRVVACSRPALFERRDFGCIAKLAKMYLTGWQIPAPSTGARLRPAVEAAPKCLISLRCLWFEPTRAEGERGPVSTERNPFLFRVNARGILGVDTMNFTRITTRPDVCTGKPCIRDLRFPVSRLLGLLASGQSRDEILRAYPYLEAADIDEALRYAASLAEDEVIEFSE